MTKIEWTDRTQNPIKERAGGNYCIPISPGCKNCYASLLNSRGIRFGGNGRRFGVRPEGHPEMALDVDMLQTWLGMRKSKKIFVGSMTDIFGEWVSDPMIFALIAGMAQATLQTFQVLTKRPERAMEIIESWLRHVGCGQLPENIWLGTSAENQKYLGERFVWFAKSLATVRFLSLEPLLGPIVLPNDNVIDWIIIGGESGPNARPLNLEWVEDILRQCKAAEISAYVKQLGSHWAKSVGAAHSKGGHPGEWPESLRVRMFLGERWV